MWKTLKKQFLLIVFCMLTTTFVFSNSVKASDTIVNQTFTSYNTINSVAFGNGMFIATSNNGTQGTVSKSTDGVNWSISATNTPVFSKVVFGGNGTFVAIDGTSAKVYTSTDGSNWISHNSSIIPQGLKAVNGNFFVWRSDYINATNPPAYNAKLFKSQDGATWTNTNIRTTSTTFGMQPINDIDFGQGKYVVSNSYSTVFYTSTDLANWTTVQLTNIVINSYGSQWPGIYNVTFLNGRFFAYTGGGSSNNTGYYNKVLTSTDGSNWSVNSSWDNNNFTGGVYLNGNYILLGDNGRIYYSNNAPLGFSGWTTSNTKTPMTFSNIVYGNGKYVACGDSGLVVSSDLINWSYISGNLKSVACDGNGVYVAAASDSSMYGTFGSIYKTTDWSTWNDVTPSQINGGVNAVTYGAGKFVAVTDQTVDSGGNSGKGLIAISTNGAAWNIKDSGIAANLTGIAFGSSKYDLVTSDGHIYTSTDGTSWTSKYSNSSYSFNTIAYLNNQFVAVGVKYTSGNPSGIVIAKSSDGLSWGTPKVISSTSNINITGIAYSGSNYVIVGVNNSTNKGTIYKSTDLTSWQNVSVNTSALNSVSFGNGGFVAVGTGGVLMSSQDGTTWSSKASNSLANLNGMIYANNYFNIVGDGFSKMQFGTQSITVTSVDSISDIDVTNGTAQGSVSLPQNVNITLSNLTTASVAITWNNSSNPSYNGNTAGTYVFTGTLILPQGVTNPNNKMASVNVIVGAPVPDPPINPTATVKGGKAIIKFTLPTNNGGSPITGYIVTVNPGNYTVSGKGSPITVTGLQIGINYAFTIKTFNAVAQSIPVNVNQ